MVIVIMGVSGSGKTTVGTALAAAVGAAFHDADDWHSAANVEKMRQGVPLDDADRAPWLAALRKEIDAWLRTRGTHVLACSALTSRSRQALGVHRPGVRLVYLSGTFDLIDARMRERRHFMPSELLSSQFEALEAPHDALALDAGRPVAELVGAIRRDCGL